MDNIKIMSLKPEYRDMVMENQKKYNSDFDDSLNESEIGKLMTDVKVSRPEDLLPEGYAIEKTLKQREKELMAQLETPENQEIIQKKEKKRKNTIKTILTVAGIAAGGVLLGLGAYKVIKNIKFNRYVNSIKNAPELLKKEGITFEEPVTKLSVNAPIRNLFTAYDCHNVHIGDSQYHIRYGALGGWRPDELHSVTQQEWFAHSLIQKSKSTNRTYENILRELADNVKVKIFECQ